MSRLMAVLLLFANGILLEPVKAQEGGVAAALLPLPESMRAASGVVRLDADAQPQVVRSSTNGMVCIMDRPGDASFDVRCYHESFIAAVYRAFQLGYAVAGPGVDAEVRAGSLQINEQPTAGYRCLGPADSFDSSATSVDVRTECWQSIHFPFRTAAEIGLPDESAVPEELRRSVPYVMGSGGYWAHVMIQHPRR